MIEFRNCDIKFSESFSLQALNWCVSPGESWAILGANGSGKSALVSALLGHGTVTRGQRRLLIEDTSVISLEEQDRLIEREKQRDDSDITDKIAPGTPVSEMLDEVCVDHQLRDRLIHDLGLVGLLGRGFRNLSTGESRKVLLARSLIAGSSLIIFDEPYEGLDREAAALVQETLSGMAGLVSMILVLNRIDEVPNFVTHILTINEGVIKEQLSFSDRVEVHRVSSQIGSLRKGPRRLPDPEEQADQKMNEDGSLVRLLDGRVAYKDKVVFEQLDWQIFPGEHWQVQGPNGSGKTCLLGLITGDHPQCYVNDLSLFGFRRGTGETIWDIKRHIGFVSTALHWDYRLSVSVMKVIISGFYDSIGLYARASEKQQEIASQWLKLLGLDKRANDSFAALSYGEQRVLLIARAMVKHPALLLLDEPCLGLDEVNRALVLSLIDLVCQAGKTTLVYVSHHEEDKIDAIERVLNLS